MSVADDNERIDVRIIEEAVAALSGIAAVLDPTQQPAGGSWVALTVHSGEEGDDVIQRAYFTSARTRSPVSAGEEAALLVYVRPESLTLQPHRA